MNSTEDLMTRAWQSLADEDAARFQAKAAELAGADGRVRLEIKREHARRS